MKAVIDIGSNSVRLAVFADGQIVLKRKCTTQLGRGLAASGLISDERKAATINAIRDFVKISVNLGVDKNDIYAFATAAVRRAGNGREFMDETYSASGVKVYLVGEDEEALLAAEGALGGKDGCVLDIGGASSELIVKKNGKIIYVHSLPLGAVVLTDSFAKDKAAAKAYVASRVTEYGKVPIIDLLTGIGGTTSCCSRVVAKSQNEDEELADGKIVSLEKLKTLEDKFYTLTEKEMEKMGVERERTGIIACGVTLLIGIMEYLGVSAYVSSENDNLLGFYNAKLAGERS